MFFRNLSVSCNPLGILPGEIGKLTSLCELWVVECQLVSIPKEIGELCNLRKLSLRKNNISQVPSELGKLHRLQWLCLEENLLSELPEQLGNLKYLSYLNLNSNKFRNIPGCLLLMSALTTLHMRNNLVANIPDSTILALSDLTRLDLRFNLMNEKPSHWKVGYTLQLSVLRLVSQRSKNKGIYFFILYVFYIYNYSRLYSHECICLWLFDNHSFFLNTLLSLTMLITKLNGT